MRRIPLSSFICNKQEFNHVARLLLVQKPRLFLLHQNPCMKDTPYGMIAANMVGKGFRHIVAEQQGPKPYQQQLYDSTLKSLLQDQTDEILNFLIGDISFIQALDGEALKPSSLRTDRFYQVLQRGKIKVAHIELETAPDSELPYRMLEYFSILYKHHRKPIIPVVIYPFQTRVPESPLRIMDEEEEILIFHYHVIALWKYNAQEYLDKHMLGIYALLPTMTGANYALLSKALDEMKEWYTEQPRRLADHLLWFGTFLYRTTIVSVTDKERLQRKMQDFESFLEQNPFVQKKKEEGIEIGIEKGREEGIIEGEIKASQKAVVTIVEGRFPELVELAQNKVININKIDALALMIRMVSTAPDEATARFILNTKVA